AAAETQSGGDLDRRDLRRFGLAIGTLVEVGPENARRYAEVLAPFADIEDDEELTELLAGIPEVQAVAAETLNAMRPLIAELEQQNRGDVRAMAEAYAAMESLSAEDRAALETLAPSAADYSDEDLLTYMDVLDDQGVVRLARLVATMDTFEEMGIALDSPEAADLTAIAELDDGAEAAREAAETVARLDAAGIVNATALQEQIQIVRSMYDQNLLTNDDVIVALTNELEAATSQNLVVRRPGNRLVVDRNPALFGIIYAEGRADPEQVQAQAAEAAAAQEGTGVEETEGGIPTPEAAPIAPERGKPETVYLRLGGSTLLFFPANLETLLVRAIPFIIASSEEH